MLLALACMVPLVFAIIAITLKNWGETFLFYFFSVVTILFVLYPAFNTNPSVAYEILLENSLLKNDNQIFSAGVSQLELCQKNSRGDGEREKIIKLLTKKIKREGGDNSLMGATEIIRGSFNEAAVCFKKAFTQNPKDYFLGGVEQYCLEEYPKAMLFFEKAKCMEILPYLKNIPCSSCELESLSRKNVLEIIINRHTVDCSISGLRLALCVIVLMLAIWGQIIVFPMIIYKVFLQ